MSIWLVDELYNDRRNECCYAHQVKDGHIADRRVSTMEAPSDMFDKQVVIDDKRYGTPDTVVDK